MATSAFGLGRRRLSSHHQCYLHCLRTLSIISLVKAIKHTLDWQPLRNTVFTYLLAYWNCQSSWNLDVLVHYYLFRKCCSRCRFQRMTASSSASWSRFSPPTNFVNGHVSTMWFMVCRWPQSQECDWARPHLCKLARHGPWPARKRFIRDHVWRGRSIGCLFNCFAQCVNDWYRIVGM